MVTRTHKKPTRKYTRRAPAPVSTTPFVVYVRYPSNFKEYAYLCDFPAKQGDVVLGNSDVRVMVIRTASHDAAATKYVRPLPDVAELARKERRFAICKRLNEIAKQQEELTRFTALARKSPEAKRLLAELKELV